MKLTSKRARRAVTGATACAVAALILSLPAASQDAGGAPPAGEQALTPEQKAKIEEMRARRRQQQGQQPGGDPNAQAPAGGDGSAPPRRRRDNAGGEGAPPAQLQPTEQAPPPKPAPQPVQEAAPPPPPKAPEPVQQTAPPPPKPTPQPVQAPPPPPKAPEPVKETPPPAAQPPQPQRAEPAPPNVWERRRALQKNRGWPSRDPEGTVTRNPQGTFTQNPQGTFTRNPQGAFPRGPNIWRPRPPSAPPATTADGKPMPTNIDSLKRERRETRNERTNSVVIKEPDNRTIIKKDGRAIIVNDEAKRFERVNRGAQVQKQSDGTNITTVQRPNNVQIVNETDRSGQLVRRYRRDAQGREFDIIDNRRKKRNRFGRNLAIGLGIGAGVVAGAAILNSVVDVPPPRVAVPRRKYIVDYDRASEDDVYEAFDAPPVERSERRYTLDEVRATSHLRDRMRRVDLNDINFDTGRWEVAQSEYRKLYRVARAMLRVIDRNPNEVFLVEGYTDAVGSEEDNLSLSDRRAESVAVILTEQFDVPPENITTQGYGEQYLKIETDGPERLNRRVALRRITPLIAENRETEYRGRDGDRRNDDDGRGRDEERYNDRDPRSRYDDRDRGYGDDDRRDYDSGR